MGEILDSIISNDIFTTVNVLKVVVVLLVVVCIFRSIKRIKKREEAEPHGQALAKMTYREAEWTNVKKSVERRGAQCKLDAGAILEELKNN